MRLGEYIDKLKVFGKEYGKDCEVIFELSNGSRHTTCELQFDKDCINKLDNCAVYVHTLDSLEIDNPFETHEPFGLRIDYGSLY